MNPPAIARLGLTAYAGSDRFPPIKRFGFAILKKRNAAYFCERVEDVFDDFTARR